MEPIVLRRASKSYGDRTVLKDISLTFPPDATTAIIGPSGSGKSTLLQLMNGLIRPDDGEILVLGKEIDYDSLPSLRKQIGYAVQGTGLFPHLTVEQNITLLAVLANQSDGEIARRISELMTLVNLPTDYRDKYPHQLSGGEQQRVGLCRAMMLDPRIFLLDEPFAALDPITRAEIHAEFLKLQEIAARTMVLVTHDLREAMKLADRIVILNEGQIEQVGRPQDIMRQPASHFVKKFVHLQLHDEIRT